MEFRPCIDIHNGKVKQIVGGSLKDKGDAASENYVSDKGADEYARLFKSDGLTGGHVILLNPASSPYYEADLAQARAALAAYPGGLQIGGGIRDTNAEAFLDMGASHVIVTSFVFSGGRMNHDNLRKMKTAVGRERLVLDLSCRPREDGYYICTDRWQQFTEVKLTADLMDELSDSCDELLVHGIGVEGSRAGIDQDLVRLLASSPLPVTYAGGVGTMDDLALLRRLGGGRVNVTVGSALDLYGGDLPYREVVDFCR